MLTKDSRDKSSISIWTRSEQHYLKVLSPHYHLLLEDVFLNIVSEAFLTFKPLSMAVSGADIIDAIRALLA